VRANFFDQRERHRAQKLMQVMDQINAQMGAQTLKFAAAGIKQPWQVKSEHKSKRFTTGWNKLPVAQA